MEKKFKIELPELVINQEAREQEIRAILNEDFEKGGLLNQCLVFTYLNDAVSTSELTDKINTYYQRHYDRVVIFRALDKLIKMGLIYTCTSGDVIILPANERKEVHNIIFSKYMHFMEKIPQSFKKNYSDMHYHWLANGFGYKLLPWSCKILKFKCDEEK